MDRGLYPRIFSLFFFMSLHELLGNMQNYTHDKLKTLRLLWSRQSRAFEHSVSEGKVRIFFDLGI